MTKNKHGGKRKGAGRKPLGKKPKRPLGIKVDDITKNKLVELNKKTGHSQAAIVEYLIKKVNILPDILDIDN